MWRVVGATDGGLPRLPAVIGGVLSHLPATIDASSASAVSGQGQSQLAGVASLVGDVGWGIRASSDLMDWFQYSPFAVVFFAATVVNLSFLLYSVLYGRNRGFDGTTASFAALLAAASIWTLMRTIQLSTPVLAAKHAAAGITYFGVGGGVIATLCFCLAYTGRDRYLTWRNVALLSIVPAIGIGLALSNPAHELLWTWSTIETDAVTYIDREFQPVYYLYIAYLYLLMVAGAALVARLALSTTGLYRHQSLGVVLGLASPMVTGLLFSFDAVPFLPSHVDPTPIGFVVLVAFFAYSTFQHGLLDLVPVARQTVIEEIDDAIVTIDGDDRIVDCNGAAQQLLGIDSRYVGTDATELFGDISPRLTRAIERPAPIDEHVAIRLGGRRRHFSLSVSPVNGGADTSNPARVVVLRDVTEIKRRESELDMLRQVQSRVLRHNIRNELTSIRGNAELLAESVGAGYSDRAHAVIDASDALLSISEKARLVEEIIDHDREVVEHDLRALVDESVSVVEGRYHDADITVDGPAEMPVTASPKLDIAIRNLIENACEHSDGPATVQVRLTDETVPTLRVVDDGPGIPEEEIEVLRAEMETQLTHGSGVGLWFVKLVVERSGGRLAFDTGSDGTAVEIRFDAEARSGRSKDAASNTTVGTGDQRSDAEVVILFDDAPSTRDGGSSESNQPRTTGGSTPQ